MLLFLGVVSKFMPVQAPLAEYLYIDELRLGSYVEQISRDGLTAYDKTPEWTVELSTTGPKVGGAQKRPARQMTTHEKIARLMAWMSSRGADDGLFKIKTL